MPDRPTTEPHQHWVLDENVCVDSHEAEAAQGAAPLDPDERYLRLREVSELLDLPAWHDDARTNNLGVDEVQGARWLASWLGVKIAGLDWIMPEGAAPHDDDGHGTVWHYCDFDSPHHLAAQGAAPQAEGHTLADCRRAVEDHIGAAPRAVRTMDPNLGAGAYESLIVPSLSEEGAAPRAEPDWSTTDAELAEHEGEWGDLPDRDLWRAAPRAEGLDVIRKAHAFIGGITPDEWATIDKAREAKQHLDALDSLLSRPSDEVKP